MSDYRVIVCGGRDEGEDVLPLLFALLTGLAKQYGRRLVVVHGGARCIDSTAGVMARRLGVRYEEYPADWAKDGRYSAGPIRNQKMLGLGADLVVGLKAKFNWRLDKGGTEDMIRRAHEAGVPCFVLQHVKD